MNKIDNEKIILAVGTDSYVLETKDLYIIFKLPFFVNFESEKVKLCWFFLSNYSVNIF